MKLKQGICILAALSATCAYSATIKETSVFGSMLSYEDQNYDGLTDYQKFIGYQQTWDTGHALHPELSLEVSDDSVYYVHAGMRVYWHNFSFAFGPGYYHQGDGPDLGGHTQFKSNIRYNITPKWHIGIYHLSNAGLKDYNPGADGIAIGYNFSAK